ncbi:type II toxin-antitoxin system VapC family toxin [Glutamicibacter protophormiae]|uniref:type II toxin-antitoxin system VapC family toxin n=1 Tax=Glutamicibacter protophormiae TaxID=37930 RepID=UPI003328516C
MNYLLDTNILSDARRRSSPALNNWLSQQRISELAISVFTIFELEKGVQRLERRDNVQGRLLREWLEHSVRTTFSRKIHPVTEEIATVAAGLHVPDPMPEMDALIAATALVHGMTLVTRNTKDFDQISVRLLNPHEL